jgi:hypothetical protein
MIKYLELALSQEVYEYLEELDEMNWSVRGNVLNQYLRNTSIGTTVKEKQHIIHLSTQQHDGAGGREQVKQWGEATRKCASPTCTA